MQKKSAKPPVMRRDRDFACVYLTGKKIHLGKWDSEEAEKNFRRIVAEWASGVDHDAPGNSSDEGSLLDDLCFSFLRWAKDYHERRTYNRFKTAITIMLKLYSGTPVREFGSKKLVILQGQFVQAGYARKYVNKLVSCIKGIFSWGTTMEFCTFENYAVLSRVAPLKEGKTSARETTPREAVPDEIVKRTLPFLLPTIADMIKVQRITGMRPSEVCRMRSCDIEKGGEIWIYRPSKHKTQWKGRSRTSYLGAEEQEILRPRMIGTP